MIHIQILINVFIIVYLFQAFSWSLSNNNYTTYLTKKYLFKYIVYMGLWHSWGMFSSPFQTNYNLDIEIIYHNNDTELVNIFKADTTQRFLDNAASSRDVKLAEHLIHNTEFSKDARRSFVKYILSLYQQNDKLIKEIVFLRRSESMPKWQSDNQCVTNTEIIERIPV